MEPMFPRLHVKDTTDKGSGPRAPPRNKMALYEQLTIPSKPPPIPAHKPPNLPPQVGDPFYMPQYGHSNSRSFVGSRHAAESSSLRRSEASGRDRRGTKMDDADDFRVPSFDQTGVDLSSEKEVRAIGSTKIIPSGGSNRHKRQFEAWNSSDKTSQASASGLGEKIVITSVMEKSRNDTLIIRELEERSESDKIADGTTTSRVSLRKDASTNAWKSCFGVSMVSCENRENRGNEDVNLNNGSSEGLTVGNHLHSNEPLGSRKSLDKGCGTSNLGDNINQGVDMLSDAREKDFVPEITDIESIPGLEIAAEAAIGIFGPKHFFKARLTIRNQQKVFANQVFELHRLIKVQKLIAGSPHLLLEGNLLSKLPQKTPSIIAGSESNADSQPTTVRQKDNLQKQDHEVEVVEENIGMVPPLPNCENRVNHDVEGPVSNSFSASIPPPVSASDNKQGPWCFHPTGNQWLVPHISPSEGLVYKPFVGPCPPAGGFLAPIFGSSHSATMVAGNYVNQMYGVPSSHQPPSIGVFPSVPPVMSNYYPAPYVLPTGNPLISNSAVEQVSYLNGPQVDGHEGHHSRSSCNKLQVPKDSELQGSTGSSPFEKVQSEGKGVFPPFQKFQTSKNLGSPSQSGERNNQARVIKVVPHNAKSASESAARIFRSIQKDRQQPDS